MPTTCVTVFSSSRNAPHTLEDRDRKTATGRPHPFPRALGAVARRARLPLLELEPPGAVDRARSRVGAPEQKDGAYWHDVFGPRPTHV